MTPDPDPAPYAASTAADLIVALDALDMYEEGGMRRPRARVTLIFCPPSPAPEIKGESFRLIAPSGPLEADELRWYLELWAIWPNDHLRERAERIENQLNDRGRKLWDSLDIDVNRAPIEALKSATDVSRQLTIHVDDQLASDSTDAERAAAAEAATQWLALPWELIHDGASHLLLGPGGIRVRRRRPAEKNFQARAD